MALIHLSLVEIFFLIYKRAISCGEGDTLQFSYCYCLYQSGLSAFHSMKHLARTMQRNQNQTPLAISQEIQHGLCSLDSKIHPGRGIIWKNKINCAADCQQPLLTASAQQLFEGRWVCNLWCYWTLKRYCVKIASFHLIVLSAEYRDKTCGLLC